MPTDRVEFLGVGFDRQTRDDIIERLRSATAGSAYQYLVTPNVDHVVKLHEPDGKPLLRLFDEADYSVCDSRILRLLARLRGLRLPLVPGSDLTARLFKDVIGEGDRIAIVGGSEEMQAELSRLYPTVEFIRHDAPMGLRRNPQARHLAAQFVASAKARFSFIAVGFPQQEMIAAEVSDLPGASGVALCVGASLEFITGHQRRAPSILQTLHLEWLFRLLADPKRMWRRYLVEGPRIFLLALRDNPKRERA